MHSLQLAERTAAHSEETGTDSDCVLKETWCKVPVFLRRKEKHVELLRCSECGCARGMCC